MAKICIVFWFFIFSTIPVFTQEPHVNAILPVVVESNKKFFSDDQTTVIITPELLPTSRQENIGYVLSRKSPLIIRNYGSYGSLASVSMHGTGSNHTQISWNGIPLNSPTTGQADLSLLPSGFVQNIEIINGASGSLFGSGTFGGSINLGNSPDWNNSFSAKYSFNSGSFGHFSHSVMLRFGTRRLQYHLSVHKSDAKNDFYFRDTYRYGTPLVKNSNNTYRDAAIMQNMYLDAGKGNFIEAGIWYQRKDLRIPQIMGSFEASRARQKDSLFRTYINYRKKSEKSVFVFRSAYLTDYLHYTNGSGSITTIDSRIHAGRIINETDYRHFITANMIAGGGFSHAFINGKSDNYGGKINENEYAFYGNLKYVLKDLIVNGGFRKEFYKGLNPPIQYSMGMRYKFSNDLFLRASFSTKFRKPSLNEKYWRPGGNLHLRPEKGFGGDLTAEWTLTEAKDGNSELYIRLTGYYQTIDNWIQWLMTDSLTPVEYKQVHASGIEAWLDYSFKVYLFSVSGNLNYNYNKSVIVDTYDDNKLLMGNQLAYIPRNIFRANTSLSYGGFMVEIAGSYTGYRETVESGDSYLRLPAYMLFDLALIYERRINQMPVGIWCRCDNLFDTTFEIIRAYPVPGRLFHIGISIGFEKINNN
jgi:vitamin B12 transporter